MPKLIVTLTNPAQRQLVQQAGAEIVAEYPDSLVVRGPEDIRDKLAQLGLEAAELTEKPLRTGPTMFSMSAAIAAEDASPLPTENTRTMRYLVRFVGPPSGSWLDELRSRGGRINGTLDDTTLLVSLLPVVRDEIAHLPCVEAMTPYRPAMKISPRLYEHPQAPIDAPRLAAVMPFENEAAKVQVEINLFANESSEEIAAVIRLQGGIVLTQSQSAVTAVVRRAAIAPIAEHPGVQAIQPHDFPDFTGNRAAAIMAAPEDRRFGAVTLRGEGQIVAVADSGLCTGNEATLHRDFAGRIVELVSLPVKTSMRQFANGPAGFNDGPADTHSGHGTHVAGSVLGDGTAAAALGEDLVPGMAPGARLYFQAIEQEVDWRPEVVDANGQPLRRIGLWGLPDDLVDLFRPAYAAGARIHTNSWGSSNMPGQYTENARQLDDFAWRNRDMLILFSAGNSGVDQENGGNGLIDPDSIGSPGTAKNCLTVGASENNRPGTSVPAPGINRNWNQLQRANGALSWPHLGPAGHVSDEPEGMAAFSSRGPTDDGRIKPDVVAPGTNVLSTRTQAIPMSPGILWGEVESGHPLRGSYVWSGGTSMSTPLVAGAAAMIREFLVRHRGHSQPGQKPSGVLVKAILVNGAVEMRGNFAGEIPPVPNNVCGFGRVNVMASIDGLQFADEPDHAVQTGQMRVYNLRVANTSRPAKVTLVWSDAPGPGLIGGLENRLYLQVVSPSGSITDGDVQPFPNAVNNVQQVRIASPEPGIYQVRVRGVSVPRHAPPVAAGAVPRQDFAVAALNCASLTLLS